MELVSRESKVVLARDLIRWDASPLNPVLAVSKGDRAIAHSKPNGEKRTKVAAARTCG